MIALSKHAFCTCTIANEVEHVLEREEVEPRASEPLAFHVLDQS